VKKSEKARRIAAILDRLYPDVRPPLGRSDPFRMLVATVLSSQTTDKAVARVSPALFSLAGTPERMAALPVRRIESAIRTLGLAPTKARHIKALSRVLTDRHGGRVPRDGPSLEALPGVGHKTASVVLSQAFGLPAFPVDTHVHRLARRWGLSSGKNVAQTERDLKRLFPQEQWGKVHLQMIWFGRQYCPARGHNRHACHICSWAVSSKRR
jgi:endonuclease-3